MRFSNKELILATSALGYIAGTAASALLAQPLHPALGRRGDDTPASDDEITPQSTERLRKCEYQCLLGLAFTFNYTCNLILLTICVLFCLRCPGTY